MRLSKLDYELPPELIAQKPLVDRDASRLLHVAPGGTVHHRRFTELPEILSPGDLLVVNDSKVFPARLLGRRASGGRVELLLLEELGGARWRVLAKPARRLAAGARLVFGEALEAEVESVDPWVVHFDFEGDWDSMLDELGRTPLPPYIQASEDELHSRERYQTVYAEERGSIAAPTAGLHFTDATFGALERRGVRVARLTLHVGYATFEPIRTEAVESHRMGIERYHVPAETAELIASSRAVVAVGTTTVRALESASRLDFAPGWHETDLFITPGFEFRVVDGLLTNFHLPKSSLLLLVSALGGVEIVRRAYAQAVKERYRFYSFGDCMLLYPARI